MTEYDNTNRGVLFRNARKETDKHPDYSGSINVGGKEFWLSGWKKDTKRGPALSLSVKPKEAARVPGSKSTPVDLDDAVPF